jgi:hypothetical protein
MITNFGVRDENPVPLGNTKENFTGKKDQQIKYKYFNT